MIQKDLVCAFCCRCREVRPVRLLKNYKMCVLRPMRTCRTLDPRLLGPRTSNTSLHAQDSRQPNEPNTRLPRREMVSMVLVRWIFVFFLSKLVVASTAKEVSVAFERSPRRSLLSRTRRATIRSEWMVRGGADVQASKTVSRSVGVVVLGSTTANDEALGLEWLIGANEGASSPSTEATLWLLGTSSDTPLYQISPLQNLSSKESLLATIGLLSDVLIVVMPTVATNSQSTWAEWTSKLASIAREKQERSLPLAKLVIVSSDDPKEVKQALESATEPWEKSEVVSLATLQSWGWGDMGSILNHDTTLISKLLPFSDNALACIRVLEQVYLQYADGTREDNESIFAMQPVRSQVSRSTTESEYSSGKVDPQDRIQQILSDAQVQLAEIETQMQEVQLESLVSNQMPLLDFGGLANAALDNAFEQLSDYPANLRVALLRPLVTELHRLFQDQLQSLRDYYGRRYELVLEQENETEEENKEKETRWATQAEHLTIAFRAGAEHSVPKLCQAEAPLAEIITFESVSSLNGLIQDMIDATERRKEEDAVLEEPDDSSMSSRRRLPPWVKKVASRAVVLGINYLQGWLAWQGLKRAAQERDREFPKFPLF